MIKVSQFVKVVPEAARGKLPNGLRDFRVLLMPWLSQVYYDDKRLHYELVKLPTRYGDNRLEIGLHFESQDRSLNEKLLVGFDRRLPEVRDALGDNWYAEPWDRGWTKIYTTLDYQIMDDSLVDETAEILAKAINVMHPIYKMLRKKK